MKEGGGVELVTCPLKIQARPPRDQRLTTQSRVSGREGGKGAIVILKQLRSNIILVLSAPGVCQSDEFQCDNLRCIDDDLQCTQYDNCGDRSNVCVPEDVTTIVIAVVVGVVLVLLVLILFTIRTVRTKTINVSIMLRF